MAQSTFAQSPIRSISFAAANAVGLCRNVPVVTHTKVYKLLFYTDFLCFRATFRSLTGALYKQTPYGPVPVAYQFLRSRLEAEDLVEVWERTYENGRTGEEFLLGPRASQVEINFDDDERRVLEFVRRELGRLTPSEISGRSTTKRHGKTRRLKRSSAMKRRWS
jgi:hypothetical protein